MREMLVLFLGQEDPLENGMSTHSSILAWRESEPLDRQESPTHFPKWPQWLPPGSRVVGHDVVSVLMSTAAGTVFSASPGLQHHSGHSL